MTSLAERILNFICTGNDQPNQLALAIFAYQYQSCQPYQYYCQQWGKTPAQVACWQDIPAVSTEAFREFDLSTLPVNEACAVFHTSGTTQERKGRHYYHDLTLYEAAIKASFMPGMGLAMQDRPIFRILTPSYFTVPTSSLYYMFQKVLEWFGAPGSQFYFKNNELDYAQLCQDLQEDIRQARAIVLLGTAFSWVNFCDYLQQHQLTLHLPQGSRLLETGGLKGRARQLSREGLYQLLATTLGLELSQCFSEYGMTELSSQCYSLANSHHFIPPPWLLTQIIDPERGSEVAVGETGVVQFFDMANLTAISAVMTADLAIKKPQGFELLGRAPQAALRGCSLVFE